MSLQNRVQEYRQRHDSERRAGGAKANGEQRTIQAFTIPTWTIVDGEVCEAFGLVDEPGMSLCVVVSKAGAGGSVPVPITDAPLFRSLGEALTAIQDQGGSGSGESYKKQR